MYSMICNIDGIKREKVTQIRITFAIIRRIKETGAICIAYYLRQKREVLDYPELGMTGRLGISGL